MHELALAEALVRTGLRTAREAARGRRVTELHVEVGELAGVVPELLASAFPMAVAGTALEGARLRLKSIPVEFRCRRCNRRFGKGLTSCPECRSTDVELAAGRGLNLVSLEVEDEP